MSITALSDWSNKTREQNVHSQHRLGKSLLVMEGNRRGRVVLLIHLFTGSFSTPLGASSPDTGASKDRLTPCGESHNVHVQEERGDGAPYWPTRDGGTL